LLFLKPLGTFINMRSEAKSVNRFLCEKRAFPQYISVVFRSSYGLNLVHRAWIKQARGKLFSGHPGAIELAEKHQKHHGHG
jgi:hypothetical protein